MEIRPRPDGEVTGWEMIRGTLRRAQDSIRRAQDNVSRGDIFHAYALDQLTRAFNELRHAHNMVTYHETLAKAIGDLLPLDSVADAEEAIKARLAVKP